ncbi:MAG: hypothetical protein LBT08_02820 [Synergistaceae bacterium]|nr:hypothetical protein [Synergistaceae bacterium]
MKKVFLSFIVCVALLSFCGVLSADVAFTTDDYSSGTIGIIGDDGGGLKIKAGPFVGYATNLNVLSYADGSRLLLAERPYLGSGGGAEDSLFFFDSSDLSIPLKNITIPGVSNTYDAEYLDGYLYLICYDGANIVKIDPDDFTVKARYEFSDSDIAQGYIPHGVSLASLGEELFALFIVIDNDTLTHANSRLVRLDRDLKAKDFVLQLPLNAHTAAVSGGSLYVASWGGEQNSSASSYRSQLQRVVINGDLMTAERLFTAAVIDGAQIGAICFAPDGTALIATHRYSDDFTTEANLYRLDSSLAPGARLKLTDSFTLAGWMTSIVYDPDTSCFWVANSNGGASANQILAFDDAGKLVKSFSAKDIGGPSSYLAAVKKQEAAGGDDGDSKPDDDGSSQVGGNTSGMGGSTGCSGGGMFGAALFIAALVWRRFCI